MPDSPPTVIVGERPSTSSLWPPVEPIASVATSMRGPSTSPRSIASRSATSVKSLAQRSRTVVNPASSVIFARPAAVTASCIGPPSREKRYVVVTCVWQSMSPGRIVTSPRSKTSAPRGMARPGPTAVIRSPSMRTTGFSTRRPATTSSIAAARTALRAGAGEGDAPQRRTAAIAAAAPVVFLTPLFYFDRNSATFSFVIMAVGSTIVFGTVSPLKIFSATSTASLPPVG